MGVMAPAAVSSRSTEDSRVLHRSGKRYTPREVGLAMNLPSPIILGSNWPYIKEVTWEVAS